MSVMRALPGTPSLSRLPGSRPVPASVRVEAIEVLGTSLQPRYSLAVGPATGLRALANLGAAPAFGGVVGRFYRVTASLALLLLWGLGGIALSAGWPKAVSYGLFASWFMYAAIQPALGVWARAWLRRDRLSVLDVDDRSDLGRTIAAYRRIIQMRDARDCLVDGGALQADLRRDLYRATLLNRTAATAATSSGLPGGGAVIADDYAFQARIAIRDRFEGVADGLEACSFGRSGVPVGLAAA